MSPPALPWHQALAYAILGVRRLDLGEQVAPDLDALVAQLRRDHGGAEGLTAAVLERRRDEAVWPLPLPQPWRSALAPAQYWAALNALRWRVQPQPTATPSTARPMTTDERRLLEDVPPHHVG